MGQSPVETIGVVAEQLSQPTTGHNAITYAEASTRHSRHAATARSTPGTSRVWPPRMAWHPRKHLAEAEVEGRTSISYDIVSLLVAGSAKAPCAATRTSSTTGGRFQSNCSGSSDLGQGGKHPYTAQIISHKARQTTLYIGRYTIPTRGYRLRGVL